MAWLKLLTRKLKTYLKLSPWERRLLWYALMLFPIITLSLKLGGLGRTQKLILRLSVPLPQVSVQYQLARVWQTARIVNIVSRYYFFWHNCLRQSLILWWLLRNQGMVSELRIGVQCQGKQFQAHAWVEYEGYPLNDSADVRKRFATFDSAINFPRC